MVCAEGVFGAAANKYAALILHDGDDSRLTTHPAASVCSLQYEQSGLE